ncbi:MAG: HAMP domain-containing protein [Endomicrobium sp.]|nr:HAMP domain-containing protein [Endomicrobium sp.]
MELFIHELGSNARLIMPLIKGTLSVGDYASLNNMIRNVSDDSSKRITIIDVYGNVLADSQNDVSAMTNHINRDEIREVMAGNPYGKSLRYSATLQENMLYLALPVKDGTKISAILRMSVPIKRISVFTNTIFKNMAAAFIFIAVLALTAAYAISQKISSGISRLSKAALEMSHGNLGVKVDINGDDEISGLAETFNKMSSEIRVLFEEVSKGREMLDKVIASVSDGILLMDKNGKILLFNEAFKKMFEGAQTERYFWELLRGKEIENAFENAKDGCLHTSLSGEFFSGEMYFSYVFSKVKNEDKFVISFKDITNLKQLDNFKKDFVTNASHELKTPVTTIIGFCETLESENLPQESRHYIDIIKKQAQRLSNIINDLLSVSSFENMKEPEKSEVNIAKIIDTVTGFYKKKALDKGIKISVRIWEGLKNIFANEFNMEQLLTNLVDNAVKYTEKGEIVVEAKNYGDFVLLTVSDTGIGIARKYLSRLFERFYVVDKSRSRKSGGTGLGLSIVKHIVQSHGGTVSLESIEGVGSRFMIKLPAIIK